MIVVEQVDNLLEADLSGQFVDVVTAVDQFTNVTPDIAEASMRSDNPFQTLRNSILSTHYTYPAEQIDRRSNLTMREGASTVFGLLLHLRHTRRRDNAINYPSPYISEIRRLSSAASFSESASNLRTSRC